MEADWDELHRITIPPPSAHELPTPASTLAFDTQQDLLWIGNEFGRVTAFHGVELRRYASFRAHPAGGGPVRQLLFHARGVLSVAPTSVHLALRRGLPQWHLGADFTCLRDLRCMAFVGSRGGSSGSDPAHLVVAGCQPLMVKIEVEKGRIVEMIETQREYEMMRFSKFICAATTEGQVDLLDADTLRVVKTLDTNNVGICDMDARNHYLVTCGWVQRPAPLHSTIDPLAAQQQHQAHRPAPMLAGLANVYDLRAMTRLPLIPFPAGAAHAQLHPALATSAVLASPAGRLQAVDLLDANAAGAAGPTLRQAAVSGHVVGLALAPSGEALALAVADGSVHLWGPPARVQFAEFGARGVVPEWADAAEPEPYIDIEADLPFGTIGMPYYREQMLSAWPGAPVVEVGLPPEKLDVRLLRSARPNEVGVWAPNPRTGRRNQAARTRVTSDNNASTSMAAPKFLSEKIQGSESDEGEVGKLGEHIVQTTLGDSLRSNVPAIYRNVEIKYSRFGVEDFDFEYYNKTAYSGLETHIANSYINPLLQLLRFTPLFRNLALRHTAGPCMYDSCLLCETGFLFDTLEKAAGQNCQATNFLKTFGSLPQAGRLGLLEDDSAPTGGGVLSDMIQAACRFVLAQTTDDYRKGAASDEVDAGASGKGATTAFEQVLTIDARTRIRCMVCRNETIRPGGASVTDMEYPAVASGIPSPSRGGARGGSMGTVSMNLMPTFTQVLRAGIETARQTRGWCDKCRRYTQLVTRREVRTTPDVLLLNSALKGDAAGRRCWSMPGWLPERIGVTIDGSGKLLCFEGEDLRLHLQKGLHAVKVYDLVGFVADVGSGENQKSHLVSLVDVNISERDPSETSDWHLFNDFLVRPQSTGDALRFHAAWKLPSVLAYQCATGRHAVDDTWRDVLDSSLLYHPYSINSRPNPPEVRPLDPAVEAPGPGTLVAIDTEFVALQQEEIEITAGGEREVVRPTRLGLARVSVLRGEGPDAAMPFINDHIPISEPVVDYLTRWSGVEEGDLDTAMSSYSLVPRKLAYKKLWLLATLGAVFVGHGLPKDFRTINIHVPRAQIRDTVDLFFDRARSQRRLSLRFLAWCLLRADIQRDTHDSIEDARTALRLYKKFRALKREGKIESTIDEIYCEGKKWGFKPPGEAVAAGLLAGREENGGRRLATLGVPGPAGGAETPEILQGSSRPMTPSDRAGSGEYAASPSRAWR